MVKDSMAQAENAEQIDKFLKTNEDRVLMLYKVQCTSEDEFRNTYLTPKQQ
jgi:hypothetical protein